MRRGLYTATGLRVVQIQAFYVFELRVAIETNYGEAALFGEQFAGTSLPFTRPTQKRASSEAPHLWAQLLFWLRVAMTHLEWLPIVPSSPPMIPSAAFQPHGFKGLAS